MSETLDDYLNYLAMRRKWPAKCPPKCSECDCWRLIRRLDKDTLWGQCLASHANWALSYEPEDDQTTLHSPATP